MKKSKKLDAVKMMPALKHSEKDGTYDVFQSEVVKWLVYQPDIMQHIFDTVKGRKLIKYDSAAGTWQGVDYSNKCPHGYSYWDDCPDCRH